MVDITAVVPVADPAAQGLDPARVAGVDLGIIHPVAVVAGDGALLISGRAMRAEDRLHLADARSTPVIQETSTEHIAAMYHEGTIGIRCPDDHVAAGLLNGVSAPVVAGSANPAGKLAPLDADQALEMLDGQVDLVLDAGRTRYGKPSTIVRVNDDGYEILREGVLDERTLRRLTQVTFLLVCTGNTCRSPMAEGLLRHLLAKRLGCSESELAERGYQVESAGTAGFDGMPASQPAVAVPHRRGIDLTGHRAAALTLEIIQRADYILTMTAGHLDVVTAMQLVEDDYLGGQGSRGSGKVVFEDLGIVCKRADRYSDPEPPSRHYPGGLAEVIADGDLAQWIEGCIPV